MATKDNTNEYRSISGQGETSEPANNAAGVAATRKGSIAQRTNLPSQSTPSALPSLRQSSSTTLIPQVSSPLAQSPRSSRNTSPLRKDNPHSVPGNQPSAAAIQRALSASNVSQLQQGVSAVPDAIPRLSAKGNKTGSMSGETTPQWPVSPRLKSPPPSGPNSRRSSNAAPRRQDSNATPSIQVLSATPGNSSPAPSHNRQASSDSQRSEPQLQAPPPPKNSARGPSGKAMLATVQENGTDTQEPSPAAVQAAADLKPLTKLSDDKSPNREGRAEDPKPSESGSESAGNKSDSTVNPRGRRPSASNGSSQNQAPRARAASSKNYASTRSKPGDGKGGMTVETETVQSIPQSGLAPASEQANRLRADNNGTVKLKPSNETIRPKKERKKADRKTRSVNQGTATSKADLFEARVANAVDEANTSDSDETFVYESNPPEPQRRQRHHSRTPSVTSSHSIAEQSRGMFRNLNDPFDDRRIGGKRSMKFSSNPYQDVDSPDSKDGTVRTHTPRHIGRHGRGGHHSATYDQGDSPFTQASKMRQSHVQRSRPTSPRSPQNLQFRTGGFFSGNRKQERPYDFDTEQNADDERTPLVGTVRTHRGIRSGRRMNSHLAYPTDPYSSSEGRWKFGRVGSCLLTTLVIILVLVSAGIFIFASNRALTHVDIHKIQNVLATEEELIMDLMVGAVNPNAWDITISEMDLNIFAKSKFVSSKEMADIASPNRRLAQRAQSLSSDRNPNPSQDLSGHWHAPADETDIDKETTTMYIGRTYHFDQAISFEASPLKQHLHFSSGQVRLMKPGNKTETGGSARWEKIIKNPFELVVRGVLKYNLPISSRQQSIAVGQSVVVHPEDGIDDRGNMRTAPVDDTDHWQWIDWPDLEDEDDHDQKQIMEEAD